MHDKAFSRKYDGYQRGLQWSINFLIVKLLVVVLKRKVHSPFIGNISGSDLANMQLISKFNKRVRFLLCVIDIFSKYACFISLKDKRIILITNVFQEFFKII